MRAYLLPPAARHGFGPSCSLRWALLTLSAGALVVLSGWLLAGLGNTGQLAKGTAALLLWLTCTALVWHWLRALPRGALSWDGATWHAELDGAAQPVALAGSPNVRLDLQSCMLLRARSAQGTSLWLWVVPGGSHADSFAWAALRRALYCRALAAPVPEGSDNGATPS
ncbi:hypothetical protein C6568_03160 [Melaminivora suipulveris]|uniref:Uncharacterized protein n=1 Tax=Melaminivora suipulveris TaxID=2109913 RepID=A0A2R3Q988_9BURK|nr:hypothetical protein [Melaminivora suipulveris]AVO48362.1 hypothetical protein C6568_03160 [Melaminivora suipulveris]